MYCLYAFINDYLIVKFTSDDIKDNAVFVLLSLFTIIEYSLFAFIIYLNLAKKLAKKIILFLSPLFILFAIFQFLNSQNKSIDAISITIEYILIIVFCIFYFFEEINQPNATFIYASYNFWIITGIFIYSTGTFFLFMQSDNLTTAEWEQWSIINYIFTILKNLFFGIALVMKKDSSKHSKSNKPPFDELFDPPINHYKPNP